MQESFKMAESKLQLPAHTRSVLYCLEKATTIFKIACDNHNGPLMEESSRAILSLCEAVHKMTDMSEVYEFGIQQGKTELENEIQRNLDNQQ
jgi:hypothetical protein